MGACLLVAWHIDIEGAFGTTTAVAVAVATPAPAVLVERIFW